MERRGVSSVSKRAEFSRSPDSFIGDILLLYQRVNEKELVVTKIIRMAVVVGFAVISAVGAHAMTSTAKNTHWSVNAGDAR